MLLFFVFLSSCSEDLTVTSEDVQENIVNYDVIEEILNLGFSKDAIQDMGSYYLVGDITFSKEGRPPAPEFESKQYRSPYLTSDLTIGVKIDSSVPNNWATATRNAMNHWNSNSGSGIYFYETDYYWLSGGVYLYNPQIEVMSDSTAPLPSNTIAAAEFPTSNGEPGYRIRINTDFSACTVTSNLRYFNMIHEFGHCVSLAHSNQGAFFGTLIPGTPTSDSASVMNGGTACTLSSGFSSNDRLAINTLYPSPLSAPQNAYAYHDGDEELEVTWNAVPGATSYRIYTQTATSSGKFIHYRTRTSPSYSRELKVKYRGSYRLLISALNANGEESKFVEPNYSWK